MLKGKGHLVELKSSPINCFFVLVAENVLRNVLTISDVKIQFFIELIDLIFNFNIPNWNNNNLLICVFNKEMVDVKTSSSKMIKSEV